MLRRGARVSTVGSGVPGASFIGVTRIGAETSVLTRATRRNIPEDTFLHGHRRENLKSYLISETLRNSQKDVFCFQVPFVRR
jgi:hypothetical protein